MAKSLFLRGGSQANKNCKHWTVNSGFWLITLEAADDLMEEITAIDSIFEKTLQTPVFCKQWPNKIEKKEKSV